MNIVATVPAISFSVFIILNLKLFLKQFNKSFRIIVMDISANLPMPLLCQVIPPL